MSDSFRPQAWRSVLDIASCWLLIIACIFLTLKLSWWFYPLSFVIIANRLLALSLICHEGLHGNLSRSITLNDFLGRYLCALPTCISFSKYRRIHSLHHQAIGSEHWDPDRHLYSLFPTQMRVFLRNQCNQLVTLKTSFSFLQYYTELPDFFRGITRHKSSDLAAFIGFHAAVLSILIYFNWLQFYFLFFVMPLALLTQPYVLLMGGLQHGPVRAANAPEGPSRTITGSSWYMWLLLPLNINYHAEHHLNPRIPHYYLARYSANLSQEGKKLWRVSYREAVRELFY